MFRIHRSSHGHRGERGGGAVTAVLMLALVMAPLPARAADVLEFPGVASLPGINGTTWRSELVLFNPGENSVTARLALVPREESQVAAEGTTTLAPGATLRIPDVYDALGAAGGAGLLQVSGGVLSWVRTFNVSTSGTFGQGVPAVAAATGLTGQEVAFPVEAAADVARDPRTNLILENLEETPVTVTVRSGTLEHGWTLPARAMIQVTRLGDQLGLEPGTHGVLLSGTGRWAGYVAVVDPLSGDPTTFRGRSGEAGPVVLFPGVAHLAGYNSTRWRSRVILHNPGDQPMQARLELIPRGSADPVAWRGLELEPGETVAWDDLYHELQAPEGAGTLRVTGGVWTWVRTYNLMNNGWTFGQAIPPADDAVTAGPDRTLLFPVAHATNLATDFRSNLLLQELSGEDATCTFTAGESHTTVTVPAGVYLQMDRVTAELDPVPEAADLTLAVTCDRPVAVYAATIDPATGDPTTVLGLPQNQFSMAPPRIVTEPAGGTVPAGSYRELSVEVQGDGPMNFQWFHGEPADRSHPVAGADGPRVTVGPVESTTSYWVEVENAGGRTASTAATLTVDQGVTAVPAMDPPPGTYHDTVEVHLSCATVGARIHYTTDGSTPTLDSPVYQGEGIVASGHVTGANDPDPDDEYVPLTTESLRIRALAEADGLEPSPEVSGAYVIDLVDTSFGVPYAPPPQAGGSKHSLDIYQPHGRTGTPVLFFVHGGAWKQGDKNIYAELGNTFAGDYGITTVVINYELSCDPWNAVFPEHIDDVADAFAWTVDHIAAYGGDPQRIWLFGQSAGGHLVSLLATDGSYLSLRGLSTSSIRGVVSMSGAYDLYDMVAFPLNPLDLDPDDILQYKALMTQVFGGYDQAILDPYSPANHANAAQPPFRVIWAWDDMPGFPEEAQRFVEQVEGMDGPAIDSFLLLESDIPQAVLDLNLDMGGHMDEIYAINTRDWDSVSTRAVASFVDPTVPFPEMDR